MRHLVASVILSIQMIAGVIPTAQAQQEFSIYCSSNMDGTGKCRKVDTDQVVNCLIIPGGVVACKDIDKQKYECVQYGAITANQTQFACVADVDNSVNDQLFTTDDFDTPDKPSNEPKQKNGTDTSPPPQAKEEPSAQPKAQPEIQNPFQANPTPEINDNEFQSVF